MSDISGGKIKQDIPSIEYREHTLGNGLKIVLSRNTNIPMVAVNTTFYVGSKDEEESRTGIAHLFEHLMFEGSPNVQKGKFDEILTGIGGESNAYTSWDSTGYYMALPINHLETGLWLDSDRLAGFAITEESLEIQKKVVLEEKLMYTDNSPYGSVEEESSKRLFTKSGYRWPVIGDMDDLQKVTINEIKDFFEKFYRPDNAVISVVGDIDYDRTLGLLEKYYGDISRSGGFERRKFSEDDIREEVSKDIYDNIQLEGKFLFYRLPEASSKDFYSASILNGILSDGESSRFFQELEYRSELANECDSNLYGMEKTSIFCISAIALKGKDLNLIQSKIDDILEDIRRGNIKAEEITKIKNKIETYYNYKRSSIVSLADKFSHLKTFYGSCEKINSEIIDYLGVTKEDIIETANKYLNQNQRVVLNYFPRKSRVKKNIKSQVKTSGKNSIKTNGNTKGKIQPVKD